MDCVWFCCYVHQINLHFRLWVWTYCLWAFCLYFGFCTFNTTDINNANKGWYAPEGTSKKSTITSSIEITTFYSFVCSVDNLHQAQIYGHFVGSPVGVIFLSDDLLYVKVPALQHGSIAQIYKLIWVWGAEISSEKSQILMVWFC